jgi:hypothetical protein
MSRSTNARKLPQCMGGKSRGPRPTSAAACAMDSKWSAGVERLVRCRPGVRGASVDDEGVPEEQPDHEHRCSSILTNLIIACGCGSGSAASAWPRSDCFMRPAVLSGRPTPPHTGVDSATNFCSSLPALWTPVQLAMAVVTIRSQIIAPPFRYK